MTKEDMGDLTGSRASHRAASRLGHSASIPIAFDPTDRAEFREGLSFDLRARGRLTRAQISDAVLDYLDKCGLEIVPRRPTPTMLAKTLPIKARQIFAEDLRLAERALTLLEGRDFPAAAHLKGRDAALDLIIDWNSMVASSPFAQGIEAGAGETACGLDAKRESPVGKADALETSGKES